jgi:hypothetical protein
MTFKFEDCWIELFISSFPPVLNFESFTPIWIDPVGRAQNENSLFVLKGMALSEKVGRFAEINSPEALIAERDSFSIHTAQIMAVFHFFHEVREL